MSESGDFDPKRLTRADFRHFQTIPTRWMDNDVYSHVNNVVYYSYFDTLVNQMMIEKGHLTIGVSPVVGIVVETHCNFFASLSFPEPVEGALRVAHLGGKAVRYEIGIFKPGRETPCAFGHFVHVYCKVPEQTPVAIPAEIRATLETLLA